MRTAAYAALLTVTTMAADASPVPRWSGEKAKQWYQAQPWPVGCNYIPSTAVNQIETWQAESFDPQTIDRELGWAEALGFNTVRIFLHDLVWEADPAGFKSRLGQFLDICQKHRIRAMVTFFTNGCYGNAEEAHLGKQPDPVPGVHNSGWVQTPGATNVNDPAKRGRLEYPWGSKQGSPEPKVWHHDILRSDGTPYDPQETAFIKQLTGRDH